MEGFIYILKSEDGRFYVGSTTDVQRRFTQHKNGQTQTTKSMKGLSLALVQKYESIIKARKVEIKIKKMKRRDYIERMVQDGYIALEP